MLVRVALAPKIKIGIDPCGETHAVLNVWVRHSVVLLVGVCLFAQQATKGHVAKAHAGLIFSSPNLINNHAIKHSLLQQGYIGGEMEGWVLFKMQEKYPRIESIIIKGISDYGDGKKDGEGSTTQVKDKWQLTAAKAAVDYAVFKMTGAYIKAEE